VDFKVVFGMVIKTFLGKILYFIKGIVGYFTKCNGVNTRINNKQFASLNNSENVFLEL